MTDRTKLIMTALVAVTLVVDGLVVATLLVMQPGQAWFFELALILATGLATLFTALMARQARRNDELMAELQRLVSRDRLTDVATRDHFFDRMEAVPRVAGVSLMVDIDHFKRINDTYGHLAGDAVIARVARILRDNLRPQDIVCRFGGEEFVIFLPDCDPDMGHAVSERLRLAVEHATVRFGVHDLRVTVSIGGAVKPARDHIERAIQAADEALYRAKRLGRNRAVLSPPVKDPLPV